MSTKKAGIQMRRQAALDRLEERLKTFRVAHKDKEPWDTKRRGLPKHHSGKKFEVEEQRMLDEIQHIKHNMAVYTKSK